MASSMVGPVHKRILKQNILKLQIHEYLKRPDVIRPIAGYVGIEFSRTSLGEQIIIYAKNPGVIVGRKGRGLRELTEKLKEKFNLMNPQLKVKPVKVPELNAQIMAMEIARAIERGFHVRRVAMSAMNRILEAGAKGVEIRIGGKLMKKRSRRYRFQAGLLVHSGELAESALEIGKAAALTKRGVIGVQVKILPPDVELPDRIRVKDKSEVVGSLEELKVYIDQLADELIAQSETEKIMEEL